MTAGQLPGVDDLRSMAAAPCPCGRGDVAAEMAHQRPLLERAVAGDARAFAELYDDNVDDVYRYLRAWTGDDAAARELTAQVFHGALTWLTVIAEGEGDLTAWLLTMARDAVAQQRGAGWASPEPIESQSPDVLLAAGQLDDAHREVAVLRLLLGHSLAHTAHLAGYSAQVVLELQLAACGTIWQMLSGTPVEPDPPGGQGMRPRWFEGCLEGAYFDPNSDPGLSDLLAVADALRQAAPRQVPLPDGGFLQRLRGQLLGELGGDPAAAPRAHGPIGRALALARFHVGRHPWAATIVATSAVGLIFGIQIASSTGARSACGDGQCQANTTEATAAPQLGAAGPTAPTLGPTTTILTTSSTAPSSTSPPTTRAPAAATTTVPPTTVATTRQQTTTTRGRGKPTTTAAPSTTATTAPPTTSSTPAASG